MPQRKRTKALRNTRQRPVLPGGDLETSMSNEERQLKLELYLQDFDVEVKSRINNIRSKAKSLITVIKSAYKLEILKLPAHIRRMKMVDYFAQGGIVNNVAIEEEASKDVTNMSDAVFQNAPRAPLENMANANNMKTQSTRKTRAKKGDVHVTEPMTIGRVLRSARKRKSVAMSPSSNFKAKAQKTQDMPPPVSTKSTRRNVSKINNRFVTPATNARSTAQTPFVTPKFDPRLPVTPALLREAKAGERIMSLMGSPLANLATPAHLAQVSIPIGNGKTFQFTNDCSFSPSIAPSLDDTARKNVELLQEKLSLLLSAPSHLIKQ